MPAPLWAPGGADPVLLQAFPQADDGVLRVPDGLVEGQDRGVRSPNLQVYLRASLLPEEPLGFIHEPPAQPPPLLVRADGQIIDPAPVALVSHK